MTRQLANAPQVHLGAPLWGGFHAGPRRGPLLSGISQAFAWVFRTRRQVTYVLLTRSPLGSKLPRSTCMY